MLPFANYNISSPSMSEKNNKRRKKKRPVTLYGGVDDELEVVKAAAWAWYQRKEGKPIIREFDLTRAPRTPKPSRYKIEATKKKILLENRVLAENRVSSKTSSLWYKDYPFREDQETHYSRLLDSYEINNISKRVFNDDDDDDSFLPNSSSNSSDFWNHNYYDNGCDDDNDDDDDGGYGYDKCNKSKKSSDGFVKKVRKIILWKGMNYVMGPNRVCGRSDDVDLRASRASRRTVKVATAAEALVRSLESTKTRSGRR